MKTSEEFLFKHEFCTDDLKCTFVLAVDRFGRTYTELASVYLNDVDIQGLLSDDVINRIHQAFEDYNHAMRDFYA